MKVVYLCDVAHDRLRRHQIFVAHCRSYFPCVEVTAGAITLQTSKRPWVARSIIAFRNLFERQGLLPRFSHAVLILAMSASGLS